MWYKVNFSTAAPSIPNQNSTTFTGDKSGRAHINDIVKYTTLTQADKCTQSSEGHTIVDGQLSPIKYHKTLPINDTARLSGQNGQCNH